MKKLTVYVAAAAATMSMAAATPASAAVKMFVVNGSLNGGTNGTCYGGGSQNINLSELLSSLCSGLPSSFPSYGNQMSEVDILRPNLPDKDCLYPGQTLELNCPGQTIPDQNCWWNCPDQNQPDQNQPDQNQPDQNQPDQNQPGQNQPGQNQPSQPGSTDNSYAQQVINLVNEERAKAGLSSVQPSETVAGAANIRAQEIVSNFSHTRPDGTSFGTVLRQAGINYRGAGENIAYGQRTPEEVMDAWMNSSGHRANILNPNYTNIGIGYYETNGVKYWVQLFTY